MSVQRFERQGPPSFYFPNTKLKNISCVHCKRQFFLKDITNVRGNQVPLLLPCGHAACEGCARLNPGRSCALCKTELTPDFDLKIKLPVNIYLLGLINVSQTRPAHADDPDIAFCLPGGSKLRPFNEQGYCSECGIAATMRCQQCNVLFCNACYSKIHGRALQNHRKIFLSEVANSMSTTLISYCAAHNKEALEYLCEECDIAGCSHCMLQSHQGHKMVQQKVKNDELLSEFFMVYDRVAENLQRVHQTQKKLKKTMIFPEQLQNSEAVEASINQHFTYLHGVLQNVEKQLIDKLYDQRTNLKSNLEDIERQIKIQEEQLLAGLRMAATANESLDKVNLKDVIRRLEDLMDIPCHLVQDPIPENEKIVFHVDKGVVDSIENHCKIEVPRLSNFNLLREDHLPQDYELEPLKIEEIPRIWEISSIRRSSPTPSVSSRRSDSSGGHIFAGSSERVRVTHINDPTNFFVQRMSMVKTCEDLQTMLENYASSSTNEPAEVVQHKLFVVQRLEDQKWYRGRINSISTNDEGKQCYEVFYVDFGFVESEIPITRLRYITSQFSTVPFLAIKCSLYDIVPKAGKWRPDANKSMWNMIRGEDCVTMHIIKIIGQAYFVDLCKNPTRDGDCPVSVRDSLIFLEHGCFVTSQKLLRTNPQSVRKFFREEISFNKFCSVFCIEIESPECIYVQKKGIYAQYLEKLILDMTAHYSKSVNDKSVIHMPEIGMPCAVKDTDGSWVRAKICNTPGERMVEVFYVDNGRKEVYKYDEIRKLHNKFMTMTTQAIKVALMDVRPLSQSEEKWPPAAIEFLKSRLERSMIKIFPFEKKDDTYNVTIYIEEDVNVNAMLVNKGLARSTGSRSVTAVVQEETRKPRKKKNPKKMLLQTLSTPMVSWDGNDELELEKAKSRDDQDPFRLCVKIAQVESPDCIYVADASREQSIEIMKEAMQDFYNSYQSSGLNEYKKDSAYAVYSARDNAYCRAKLLEIKSSKEIVVFFYDMGITDTTSMQNIEPLHKKFLDIPMYLFKVRLAGILPCGGSNTWTSHSCEKLSDIIQENQNCKFFISKVTETEDADAIPVELFVKQARTDGPLLPTKIEINSVNRMLVESGVALPIKDYMEKTDKVLAVELRRQLGLADRIQGETTENWHLKEQEFENMADVIHDLAILGKKCESLSESDTLSDSEGASLIDESLPPKLAAWIPPAPILDDRFVAVATYLDHNCVLHLHSEEQNGSVLKMIEEALEEHYKNVKIKPYDKVWKEGEICVAQYHCNKKWYRAQVLKVLPNDMIQVQFVDYGNIEECAVGTLKKRVIMGHLPIQCTKCVIYGLNTEDDKWLTQDLDKIHALLVDKESLITVLERKPEHLVVSVMMLQPKKQDLISYLFNELNMDVRIGNLNSSSEASVLTESDTITTDTPDVIVEGFVKDDKADEESENGENLILEPSLDEELFLVDESKDENINDNVDNDIVSAASSSIKDASAEHLDDDQTEKDMENMSWVDIISMEEQLVTSTLENESSDYPYPYARLSIPNNFNLDLDPVFVFSPTGFFGSFSKNKHSKMFEAYVEKFEEIHIDMQKNSVDQPLLNTFEPNTPCCAKFTQDDTWYRGIVVNVEEDGQIKLQFVDYGNEEYHLPEEIHVLKEEWQKVPVMCAKCRLWCITLGPGQQVTPELKERLTDIFYKGPVKAKVKESCDDLLDVELYADEERTMLLYGTLIEEGLFQLKTTKAE
ncbi:RING finger protein 17 isoform X2 [Orussus abietinus]|uniref:RING finger protein 17 isoform X2 n=1 Tax=Orussus abietinus TaxID=222816 RepID=UPI000625A5E0|nr:RING finger protein 17 isoform X2 [Orussus abietinus]